MRIPLLLFIAALALGAGLYFAYGRGMVPEVAEIIALPEPLAPVTLATTTVDLGGGEEVMLRVPEGYRVTVAAEELGKARFMAMSPDGRLFVPDMVNYNLSHDGRIFVLDGFDPATGKFTKKTTYLSGLRTPNDLLFYKDEDGQDWLYVALTAHLVRYKYEPGDTAPSGPPEIVVEFPNEQSPGEVSVVWHITRSLTLHDGRIYIAVGSGCNACEQLTGDMRAMIYSVLPDGTDPKPYADHLRNGVGMAWAGDTLYATANGVDHLGTDAPDEMLYKLHEGIKLGWPYCYEDDGEIVPDTSRTWENAFSCDQVPHTFAAFAPRSAPLGIEYFEEGPAVLKESFLVALHGSFDVSTMSGNEVVRVDEEGKAETFIDGFFDETGTRIIRIVDFLEYDENSFFMSDDQGGRILFVRYAP